MKTNKQSGKPLPNGTKEMPVQNLQMMLVSGEVLEPCLAPAAAAAVAAVAVAVA